MTAPAYGSRPATKTHQSAGVMSEYLPLSAGLERRPRRRRALGRQPLDARRSDEAIIDAADAVAPLGVPLAVRHDLGGLRETLRGVLHEPERGAAIGIAGDEQSRDRGADRRLVLRGNRVLRPVCARHLLLPYAVVTEERALRLRCDVRLAQELHVVAARDRK